MNPCAVFVHLLFIIYLDMSGKWIVIWIDLNNNDLLCIRK